MPVKKQRYCVRKFADAMEERLAANDHKDGWEDCDDDYLWGKFIEELSEFQRVINKQGNDRKKLREAADLANIVMMLADNATWHSHPLKEEE